MILRINHVDNIAVHTIMIVFIPHENRSILQYKLYDSGSMASIARKIADFIKTHKCSYSIAENDPINICFYTSFLFFANYILCAAFRYYLYALLFYCLFITSILVRLYPDWTAMSIIDKLAVYSVVLYGGFIFYRKLSTIPWRIYAPQIATIFATFLATIFLFFVGWWKTAYCFHSDFYICNFYHAILHFASFLGHALIVVL